MNKPQINYNKTVNYTVTNNNNVGPTSDTSIRSGFDCASASATYSNANTRFFKSTGNDGASGLFATPKLTLEGAVSQAVTDVVTNVACLDDVADFEGVVTSTIPASFKIVAANGKAPRLKWGFDTKIVTYMNRLIKLGRMNNNQILALGQTNLYSSSNGNIFTNIKPASTSVIDYLVIPNADRILCSSIAGGNLGVYYSDNFGSSWSHPYTANAIYYLILCKSGRILGFGLAGLQIYSDDNGASWTALSSGLSTQIWSGILTDSGRIFAYSGQKLYYTDDEGISWRSNMVVGTTTNSIVKNDQGKIFLLSSNELGKEILYYSNNNGSSWAELLLPISPISGVTNYTALSIYKNRLYMFIGINDSTPVGYITYSDDEGYNWTTLSSISSAMYQAHVQEGMFNHNYIVKNRIYIYHNVDFDIYIPLEIIPQLNNTLEVNGFYLDGKNEQALGIISGTGSQTNTTVKYCDFANFYDTAVKDVDKATLTADSCSVSGGKGGFN